LRSWRWPDAVRGRSALCLAPMLLVSGTQTVSGIATRSLRSLLHVAMGVNHRLRPCCYLKHHGSTTRLVVLLPLLDSDWRDGSPTASHTADTCYTEPIWLRRLFARLGAVHSDVPVLHLSHAATATKSVQAIASSPQARTHRGALRPSQETVFKRVQPHDRSLGANTRVMEGP